MKKEIRARGILQPQDYQQYIEHKITAELSHLRDQISGVTVWLEDLNGPKGGIDKCCRVRLLAPKVGPIIAESRDINLKGALSRAIEIASQALSRALCRLKSRDIAAKRLALAQE